jgi:hypothetical protein
LLIANFFIGQGLAELRPQKDEDEKSEFDEEKMVGCFFRTLDFILPNLGDDSNPFLSEIVRLNPSLLFYLQVIGGKYGQELKVPSWKKERGSQLFPIFFCLLKMGENNKYY